MWKRSAEAWIERSEVDVVEPLGCSIVAAWRPKAEALAGSSRSTRMMPRNFRRTSVEELTRIDGVVGHRHLGAAREAVALHAPLGRHRRRGVALDDDRRRLRRPAASRCPGAARRAARRATPPGPRWTRLVAGCGRRPDVGPVRVGDGDPDAVAGANTQPVVSSSTSSVVALAGRQRLPGPSARSRRVTLSMPLRRGATTPSGATSAEAHGEADHASRVESTSSSRRRTAERRHVLVERRRV